MNRRESGPRSAGRASVTSSWQHAVPCHQRCLPWYHPVRHKDDWEPNAIFTYFPLAATLWDTKPNSWEPKPVYFKIDGLCWEPIATFTDFLLAATPWDTKTENQTRLSLFTNSLSWECHFQWRAITSHRKEKFHISLSAVSVVNHYYTALFSALEHTHCAPGACNFEWVTVGFFISKWST